MRFAVTFLAIIGVTASWALKVQNTLDKEKREAAIGYPSPQEYQPQSYSQGANAISIGAGYSVGGGKPSYSFGESSGIQSGGQQLLGHQSGGQSAALHYPSFQSQGHSGHQPAEGLQPSAHRTIQLAPITLQPSQNLGSNDLTELMNQLSQGINSGAIALSPYQGQSQPGGQEYAPVSFGSPKYELSEQTVQAIQPTPSYASGSKGLSSYGSTGPVLFNPGEQANQGSINYAPLGESAALPHSGSGYALSGLSIGGSGNSLGGHGIAIDSAGPGLGGHGYSLINPAFSIGSGHSFGGYKTLNGGYHLAGKPSFKPSTYLGSSLQTDNAQGLSSLSGSYAASPSLGHSPGGHGPSIGSSGQSVNFAPSKYSSNYPKSGMYASLDAIMSQFSNHGSGARGIPSASHAASAHAPQYYASPSKYNFGEGGASFRAPSSGHSSLGSGPSKFAYRPSRYVAKDSHGAFSETSYNTIKYSEELKPRVH